MEGEFYLIKKLALSLGFLVGSMPGRLSLRWDLSICLLLKT